MGLLKGLLRARKLLLVISVPLLLLPLPMLHSSSVSTGLSPPGAGGVRWEVKEGWWLERKGCLCSSSVLFCAFEEMEVFSWRTLKYFLPKNCPFHPSISFPVSHPMPPARSEVRGEATELPDVCSTNQWPGFPSSRDGPVGR